MSDPITAFDCYHILFGGTLAHELSPLGNRRLKQALNDDSHPLAQRLGDGDRARLRAVLRLAELHYRDQAWPPTKIDCVADVVRLIQPRIAPLRERVIWLLPADASGSLGAEVLVQIGGDPIAAPSLRSVLRHALHRGAVTAWIADFRPVEDLAVQRDDVGALAVLTEVGAAVGVAFADWVLLSPNAVRAVRDGTPLSTATTVLSQAA